MTFGWLGVAGLVAYLALLIGIAIAARWARQSESPADSVLLSLGSVVAEDLFGRSHREADTTRFGKRAAAVLMIGMALLAIGARHVTLWGVIELKMELLIQCVPVFLIAIHWPRLRARPALLGLACGVAIALAGVALGSKRIFGVHIGVIGLAVNAAIACIGSLARSPRSPPHRALHLQ